MAPTEGQAKTYPVQRSVLDLDTFETVTLVKQFEYSPVASVQEAVARLNNEEKRLLQVINDGLLAETRRQIAKSPDGWKVQDDEGNPGEDFAGTPANEKIVNALILNMAKASFGYSKDASKETKKGAKNAARDFVKGSPPLIAGLKKSAAINTEEDEDAG